MLVLLAHCSSPSEKTTAPSQRLTSVGLSDLPTGNFHLTMGIVPSRKVKSEVNLTDLRHVDHPYPTPGGTDSISSRYRRNTYETAAVQVDQLVESPLVCDAFIALKELGVLVARRKGLEESQFVKGLMVLFSSAESGDGKIALPIQHDQESGLATMNESKTSAGNITLRPLSRKTRFQSRLEHNQTRRRHFSFEPGDDHIREPGTDLRSHDALSQASLTNSDFASSSDFSLFDSLETDDDDTTHCLASASGDPPKPTMIPSPVQTMGRIRRENSMSSLQSVSVKKNLGDRHDSRISIQTAFQETASISTSIKSRNGSRSSQNLYITESPAGSKERLNGVANRQSSIALTAARVADARSSILSRSDMRLSTATSSYCQRQTTGQQRTENNDPRPHSDAGKRDVE